MATSSSSAMRRHYNIPCIIINICTVKKCVVTGFKKYLKANDDFKATYKPGTGI